MYRTSRGDDRIDADTIERGREDIRGLPLSRYQVDEI
jgi:hypothetical protein